MKGQLETGNGSYMLISFLTLQCGSYLNATLAPLVEALFDLRDQIGANSQRLFDLTGIFYGSVLKSLRDLPIKCYELLLHLHELGVQRGNPLGVGMM